MRISVVTATVVLAVGLTACSGGAADDAAATDAAAPAAADGAATFVGTDALTWEAPASATLVDGQLDVTLECAGTLPHNIVFEGVDDDDVIAECTGNDQDTGTVQLEPGTYTYYCAIPGHRSAGMEQEISLT